MMAHPRTLILLGKGSQSQIVEIVRRPARADLFHQRRDRSVRRRERRPRSLQGPGRERRRVPRGQHARAGLAERGLLVALLHPGREAGAQRRDRNDGRRGRRVHAERPVPGRRRAARRQPHDDRSRDGALSEPRDLQGHPRRQGARRVQRQDHRASGRAEDRREADQPRAAALRRCDDQHQAAARDFRRRREVHARRGDRSARRRRRSSTCARAASRTWRRATC